MTTIPTCAALDASGTTLQDYVTQLYTWLLSNPGNFTISNAAGVPVSSWTMTHIQGWQLNFRTSGATLLCMIAPSGGVVNSASPGTPAGFTEVVCISSLTSTNIRCLIARYEDAVFFGIRTSTLNGIGYAFVAGRIGAPIQGQDIANGMDGLGILSSIPTETNTTAANAWFSTNAARTSRLRLSATEWVIGLYSAWGPSISQSSGTRRFTPAPLVGNPDGVGVPSASQSPLIALCKYVAWAGGSSDSVPPFTLNNDPLSNQSWMAINSTSAVTRMRILWNKTVDPVA
jgi:hypothetical protein